MPDPMSSLEASRVRRPGFDAEAPPAERRRRLWAVLPVCAGFAVFGVVVWLAYQDASLGPPGAEPPLIRAAPEPIKLPPEQAEETTLAAEQGAVGRLWSDAEQADQPERLLPPPEQPLAPPSGESPAGPAAGEPATGGAAGGETGGAALPSGAPAQGLSDSATLQPPTDESLQEAEAALDRLLAEVTALPEGTEAPAASAATSTGDADAPGPTAAVPAEDTDAPGATAAVPGVGATAAVPATDTDVPAATAAVPAEDADAPAARPAEDAETVAAPVDESPTGAPAPASAAAAASTRAVPAVPPQKPMAPVAAAATSATDTEVPPAEASTAAPAPNGSTETAALSPTRAPPPVAADGEFRIQLAAVRGQADARRAWDLFAADMAPVLSGMEPIFERADTTNGVFYRVQIGPFASQQTAESLCEQLKQHNASCFVIRR